MKIESALFSASSVKLSGRPNPRLPEFAFIGRSNVGKSSLINMLCKGAYKEIKGKELAHTSSNPGKTICINHFLINNRFYIVDMPGYGYAKLSKTQRESLAKMNNEYLNGSNELANLFVLIDCRHPLQSIDLEFLTTLGENGIPFSVVFTKTDKLGTNALKNQINSLKAEILKYWEEMPPYFVTSAATQLGKEEILRYMSEVLQIMKKK